MCVTGAHYKYKGMSVECASLPVISVRFVQVRFNHSITWFFLSVLMWWTLIDTWDNYEWSTVTVESLAAALKLLNLSPSFKLLSERVKKRFSLPFFKSQT